MKVSKARLWQVSIVFSLLLLFNVIALFGYLRELRFIVIKRIEHLSWSIPTTIYSQPFLIFSGMNIEIAHLIERLGRLGYQRTETSKVRPGEYQRSSTGFRIHTQPALLPEGQRESEIVEIFVDPKTHVVKKINLKDNQEVISTYLLEPEIISYIFSDTIEKRQVIKLEDVSPLLWKTVIMNEDSRFHEHVGIDVVGIMRAFYKDIIHGSLREGGSTITQQLVKNFFLSNQRKLIRKTNEVFMSILLEKEYSKEKILEAYLNEIYFGQDGSYPIHGIQEASLYYFSKNARDLEPAEVALLVGLIPGPGVYSPFIHPEKAKSYRDSILKRMGERELISTNELELALESEIPLKPKSRHQKRIAPYFVDTIISELNRLAISQSPSAEGLHVFTTLDPLLQTRSMAAFKDQVTKLQAPVPLDGAFILLDHRSGAILALSGGVDYGTSQFNRATQARRQIGSLFKPVIYLQALNETYQGKKNYYMHTPVDDTPLKWEYDGQSWEPKNYDEKFHDDTTFRQALIQSYNVATARIGMDLGVEPIVQLGIQLGFSGPIPLVPSVVLGSSTSSVLEVATVFGTLANSCFQYKPFPLMAIYSHERTLLWKHEPQTVQVTSPAPCGYLKLLLLGTLQEGTAGFFRNRIWAKDFASKTGTTSDWNDSWFAGFDQQWTLIVWVGNDQHQSTKLTGAAGALPVWAMMLDSLQDFRSPDSGVPMPDEITLGRVPKMYGSQNCNSSQSIYYFTTNPPLHLCP